MVAAVSSPELVGREEEIETLRVALENAAAGEPSLTVVIGDAGVGKTRLVQELETDASNRGMLAMRGECLELSACEFPYAPLAAALRHADPTKIHRALSALPDHARQDLSVAFADVIGASPGDRTHDEPFGQSRLFVWLLRLLTQLSTTGPTLLIIEDLQWADTSSRDFLQFLVHSLRSERLAVVATVRSEELYPKHPVRSVLARLDRLDLVRRLELKPLTEPAVERQVAAIIGTTPPHELVQQLFARAEGNPFYTEELLAAGAIENEDLPATLRDALLLRTEALQEDSRGILRLVAALGRPAHHTFIWAAAGLPEPELEPALRECVDQHHLSCDRGTGNYSVRHTLAGEAVYSDLLPSERAVLHRRIAQALEQNRRTNNAAERARHWELAHEPSFALHASAEAGLAAEHVFGYGEALTHFERAIELWSIDPPPAGTAPLDLVGLLAHAAEAARWMGDSERARTLCERALNAFDHTTDPVRAARLYERLGRYQPWNVEASLSAYRHALEILPTDCSTDRMRLHVDEALAFSFLGRWEEARDKAIEALNSAQGDETVAIEASGLAVLGVAIAFIGDLPAGERHLRRALRMGARGSNTQDRAQVHLDLGEVLRLQGRVEDALEVMLAGEKIAVGFGADRSYGNFMAVNAADDLLRLGRWDELELRLRELQSRHLEQTAELLMDSVAGRLATARGRLDEAATHFDRAVQLCETHGLAEFVPAVYGGYAELELWRQRPVAARVRISDGLAKLGDADNLLHVPVLHATATRVEAEIAELAKACGDATEATRAREAARDHHERLAALIASHPGTAMPPEACAHLASGDAELTRANDTPRPTAWEDAASRWRQQAAPYQLAYSAYRLAEALVLTRGQRAKAQRALQEASGLSSRLGAAPLTSKIASLARRTRLSLTSARPHDTASRPEQSAPFGLTEREIGVLSLIGAGLTNREISQNLYISPHTTGVHVSHILAKLGVSNRVAAASIAERLGLTPRIDSEDILRTTQ